MISNWLILKHFINTFFLDLTIPESLTKIGQDILSRRNLMLLH